MYPLSKIVEPMKPCKPDIRKESHRTKLQEALVSNDYILECKHDGIGCITVEHNLFSIILGKHTGEPAPKNNQLPYLLEDIRLLPKNVIVHGEIYYPGKKVNFITTITGSHPSVAREKLAQYHSCMPKVLIPSYVESHENLITPGYPRYVLFDILRDAEGNWLTDKPFIERRKILEEIYYKRHLEFTDLNRIYTRNFKEIIDEIISKGLEGAVLKSKKGKYICGKRPMWNQIKIKQKHTDGAIIIGFNPAKKDYIGDYLEEWLYWIDGKPVTEYYYKNLIGSIKVGKYCNGQLKHIGNVSGITMVERRNMTNHPELYVGKVAKIKFMESGVHKAYRHASFVELHPDKNPKECRLIEND